LSKISSGTAGVVIGLTFVWKIWKPGIVRELDICQGKVREREKVRKISGKLMTLEKLHKLNLSSTWANQWSLGEAMINSGLSVT